MVRTFSMLVSEGKRYAHIDAEDGMYSMSLLWLI